MNLNYMTDEEEAALVLRVWEQKKEDIIKSVESAIRYELSTHMNTRARRLVEKELDELLKPEIESRKELIKGKITLIGDRMIAKVDDMLVSSMSKAIDEVVEYQLRQVVERALKSVSYDLITALKDSVGSAPNR
jgi:uncharacterized protein involved in tolerance to divalent cations